MLDLLTTTQVRHFADAVLCLHIGVVAFVVFGQLAILAGGAAAQEWVRNFKFRAAHLALIVFIAVQTSLGQVCPLTKLEHFLRLRAGQQGYTESFTQHWLAPLIFFDAPWWTFVVLHSFVALVVVGSWRVFPPSGPRAASR